MEKYDDYETPRAIKLLYIKEIILKTRRQERGHKHHSVQQSDEKDCGFTKLLYIE